MKKRNRCFDNIPVVDATEPLEISITQEILDYARRKGMTGRQMMAYAIMRSINGPDDIIVVDDDGVARSVRDEH